MIRGIGIEDVLERTLNILTLALRGKTSWRGR
jgi:hypothetical protein